MSGRVLVVDDEPDVRFMLRAFLESDDIEVLEASSGPKALELLEQDSAFDAVVLDHRMPLMTGIEFARILDERGPHPPLVLFSGYLAPDVIEDAGNLNLAFVPKRDLPRLLQEISALMPSPG
jgi:two-component system NtrC family sensor kinase